MFPNLVPDMNYLILSQLNAKELCRLSETCKSANQLMAGDEVWQRFFPKIHAPSGLTLKKHFNVTAVVSISALIRRIEIFSLKLPYNQNGEFYCYFPQETRCFFGVRIINNPKAIHCGLKECNFFMKTSPMTASKQAFITIGRGHHFLINARLPNNINSKITKKVIDILTKDKPKPMIAHTV